MIFAIVGSSKYPFQSFPADQKLDSKTGLLSSVQLKS